MPPESNFLFVVGVYFVLLMVDFETVDCVLDTVPLLLELLELPELLLEFVEEGLLELLEFPELPFIAFLSRSASAFAALAPAVLVPIPLEEVPPLVLSFCALAAAATKAAYSAAALPASAALLSLNEPGEYPVFSETVPSE